MPERTTLLAGVGGTVTVLASIERDLADYDPALLEGLWIDQSRAREIIRNGSSPPSHVQRRELPIMGGPADIIGAGASWSSADRPLPTPGLVCSTGDCATRSFMPPAAEVGRDPLIPSDCQKVH